MDDGRALPESLEELFRFKNGIIPDPNGGAYILEDGPVVCGWHPTSRAAVLWNLTEQPQGFNLQRQQTRRPIRLVSLDTKLTEWLD